MALSKIDVANMLTGIVPNDNTIRRPNSKPLIINGDMAVAQRNTGTVAQADDSNEGYATVHRFGIHFANAAGGTIITSRDTTAPTGFGQSMKLNVTSADASVASTHIVYLQQSLEAQTIRNSGWDYTSSSSYLTLSFYIRSSKTGTYCVYFQTNDGTAYMYTAEYTISSADTWEQKVITVPGNSNLTFNNDNGVGLRVAWVLAVGTDRDGTADSWTTGNAYGTSNQVNFLDSTDNIAYITGVQLEVGQFTSSTLPPFQHESFGDNLARCQRYFQMIAEGNQKIISMAHWGSSTEVDFVVELPTTMRARPTLDYTTGNEYWAIGGSGGSTNTLDNLNVNTWSTDSNINLWSTTGAGGTAGFAYYGYTNNASAKLGFTSEL